ncbi:MAG: PEP-CTERM sorting domain-containing protein [Akkermansiaceae bacterium]
MKKSKLNILTIGALSGVLVASNAQAALWDGGGADTEYSTALNWDDDLAPAAGTTATINGLFTVDRTVDSNSNRINVEGGATLNITAGNHSDSASGNTTRNYIGNGSTGTVNVSGASTVYNVGHIVVVGNGAAGNGTITQTDGSFAASRGGNSFMGIAGGSSMEVGVGGATGLYEISGGSFTSRIGVGVGGGGTFSVVGSNASTIGIGSNGSLDGSWNQASGGTLKLGLDAGGSTLILVDVTTGTGVGAGNVTFESGSILDLYDAGGAVTNVWQTVMSWEGALTDNGLALSSAATSAGWEKQVVGSDLQVRLVPEPSSTALLGLGGLAFMLRRRK